MQINYDRSYPINSNAQAYKNYSLKSNYIYKNSKIQFEVLEMNNNKLVVGYDQSFKIKEINTPVIKVMTMRKGYDYEVKIPESMPSIIFEFDRLSQLEQVKYEYIFIPTYNNRIDKYISSSHEFNKGYLYNDGTTRLRIKNNVPVEFVMPYEGNIDVKESIITDEYVHEIVLKPMYMIIIKFRHNLR